MGTETDFGVLTCGYRKGPYIQWELENDPHMYDKPRCNEFIDRQTLTHVLCNVDCPVGIDLATYSKVVDAINETLDLFPWLKPKFSDKPDLELLEASGFEI